MFIVLAPKGWFLKGTVWTSDQPSSHKFLTEGEARVAIAKAAKFSKPKLVKTWRIIDARAFGQLGHHQNHPERLCVMHLDGTPSNYLPLGYTREQVVADFAEIGWTLLDDNTVIKEG
jgi:hypothetical protein